MGAELVGLAAGAIEVGLLADLTLLREAHDDLVLQRGDEYRVWWDKIAWNRGLEKRER